MIPYLFIYYIYSYINQIKYIKNNHYYLLLQFVLKKIN